MNLTTEDLKELLQYLDIDTNDSFNLEKLKNNSYITTIDIDSPNFLSSLLSFLNEFGIDFNNPDMLDCITNFVTTKKGEFSYDKTATNATIIKIIDCLLHDLNVPNKFLNSSYLKDAIAIVANLLFEEPKRKIAVGKEVYTVIAKKYNTTPSSVERNIRYSILEIENINYNKKSTIADYFYGKDNTHYTNNKFIYKSTSYVLNIMKNAKLSEEEIFIDETLVALGIKQSTYGYNYLKDSLLCAINYYKNKTNEKIIVSKVIYPTLANKYHTQPINIEQGIKSAIMTILKSKNFSISQNNEFIKLFYSNININLTNSGFINTFIQLYFSFQKNNYDNGNFDNKKTIEQILLKLGLTYNYLGQKYLKDSIILMMNALENGLENPKNITKYIYPTIAQKFNTTTANVEHNIRTAISKIKSYNQDKQNELVKELHLNSNIHYTNGEFIILLAQYLRNKNNDKDNNKEMIQLDIIDTMLKDLGINSKYFGYSYLKASILEAIKFYKDNPKKTLYVTKDIYPTIAKKYNISIANVEYNIRTIINNISKIQNSISNKQNDITKALYDGNNISYSNSQFINALVQYFYEKQATIVLEQTSPQITVIESILNELGIPRNYVGFNYLRDALLQVINVYNSKPKKRLSFAKEVYPAIAEKYGVSPENINLCISNIITKIECLISKNTNDVIFYLYPTKSESYSNIEFFHKLVSYYYSKIILDTASLNDNNSLNKINKELIDAIMNSLLLDSTTTGYNLFRELILKVILDYDKGCNLNDIYLSIAQTHNISSKVIWEEISKTIKDGMNTCINIGFYTEVTEAIYSSWMHSNPNEVISNFVEFYYTTIKKSNKIKNQKLLLNNSK